MVCVMLIPSIAVANRQHCYEVQVDSWSDQVGEKPGPPVWYCTWISFSKSHSHSPSHVPFHYSILQTRCFGTGHASLGTEHVQCQDRALLQVSAAQGGGEWVELSLIPRLYSPLCKSLGMRLGGAKQLGHEAAITDKLCSVRTYPWGESSAI